MVKSNYKNPSQDMYFVFELGEKIVLGPHVFDVNNNGIANQMKGLRNNKKPFTLSLMELAKIRSKK